MNGLCEQLQEVGWVKPTIDASNKSVGCATLTALKTLLREAFFNVEKLISRKGVQE